MSIPNFEEIVETNDQTEARSEHLEKLRELVGNVYPNKFVRSSISGSEDTISALIAYEPVATLAAEMAAVKASLKEGERPPAEIKDAINGKLKEFGNVRIAGRLTTPPRGNFVHLTDGINKLQIYAKKATFALVKNDGGDTLDEENGWAAWQLIDHGDFIGVEGYLFVTNTGEVSVHVEKLQFLAKAMLPMPDKMHGIADAEIKQRQRYVDLIGSSLQVKSEPPASAGGTDLTGNESGADGAISQTTTLPPAYAGGTDLSTREVFERRAKIISSMRRHLEDSGYIEVETPMLTPKATGATAKPFVTHHNALDITLYARIAPELYLKRLVVGGFEKVYELNRNFRNEGISYKHNPEFTMLEFYCAYMDVNGMMDFCEEMLRESVKKATGGLEIEYEGKTIDFSKFERVSMKEAIVNVSASGGLPPGFEANWLDDYKKASALARFTSGTDSGIVTLIRDFNSEPQFRQVRASEVPEFLAQGWRHAPNVYNAADRQPETTWEWYLGETETVDDLQTRKTIIANSIARIFEFTVEKHLIQPTFIIDYPKSISPLSKASPQNPQIAERFELFINGMEVANGFSELNDPKEQYDRFVDQMSERERGDEEAMILDEDYIRALSYGMPPAAGIGIGIDRLVMLLTNKHSIRDVILFPHMRPEKNTQEETE